MSLEDYEIGEKFQCSEGLWWIKFNETQYTIISTTQYTMSGN